MIVVDASVLVEVLLGTPEAGHVEERLFGTDEALHAPHIIDLEVTQVLRRWTMIGTLSPERGRHAIHDLQDMPMSRHSHRLFVSRIWELRSNLTAYDAAYVTLAETLGATLLTRDKRLANSGGHQAQIEFV